MLPQKVKRPQPIVKDPDRVCIVCGSPYKAVAALQKTCSVECRRKHYKENQDRFKLLNPGAMKRYNQNRKEKDPDVWKMKWRDERNEIIALLGGKCCVPNCSTINPNHLHIDYIPTMVGTGFAHPRYKKWVIDHLEDFRLLCANHHYELTTTGKIEGTEIRQNAKGK